MLERVRVPDARDRRRTGSGLATALSTGLLSLALAVPGRAQDPVDTVLLKNGQTEPGTVVEEVLSGVTIKPEKGPKKTIPWDTVQSIEYADAPAELANANAALTNAQYDDAAERFAAIADGEEKPRPMITQQALFYAAYARQRAGHLDEAITGYQKLLTAFPHGRFLRSAGDNLTMLLAGKGDAAGAHKAVDALAAGAADLPGFAAEVAILHGRLLLAEGKPAEARTRFEEAEKAADAPEGVKQEARLCLGSTLLAEKKAAEAEPIFTSLKDAAAPPRVQSGAWNGLGELFAEDGKAKRDSDRILDGLYAYLRTVVQYKPAPGESTAEYERALAGAATCFKYISELEQNNERKKLFAQRSREKFDQLQREFPDSTYLQEK
jgi:predicted negative regulator of RcsB-dependent stress response